ncbi:MAG: aminoacyl-tRNA hydrolase [Lachnospiraceae bacterium]|nr:aminoacyl-tRNA hydrolase [Lachnospiraceae bacterium]
MLFSNSSSGISYLIVGLGNPGAKYDKTRHNMGFDVIDRLIEEYNVPQSGTKFHAMIGKGTIGTEKVLLMKPLTYMNLSGTAVREAVNFYKLDPATQVIVISDDIDLAPGKLRIRKKGSAGGQNGLKHIIAQLGTDQFTRIRVGTGSKPEGWQLADWVLSRFSAEDRKAVDEAIDRAAKAAACIVTDGPDKAMNLYNG